MIVIVKCTAYRPRFALAIIARWRHHCITGSSWILTRYSPALSRFAIAFHAIPEGDSMERVCSFRKLAISGVFRRGLVGVNPPHDLTDEQAKFAYRL